MGSPVVWWPGIGWGLGLSGPWERGFGQLALAAVKAVKPVAHCFLLAKFCLLHLVRLPSGPRHWFRPAGRVTFSKRRKSNQKRFAPASGLGVPGSLRSTSLIPAALRGPAYKGHPWPFTPLAASMPLASLRADYIRPSERGVRRRLLVRTR